jgi:predicted transcriptional regulator
MREEIFDLVKKLKKIDRELADASGKRMDIVYHKMNYNVSSVRDIELKIEKLCLEKYDLLRKIKKI